MNKIVELVINLEEFEFEDLGVEILSLVDKPAIEVEWMAFSEEEEAIVDNTGFEAYKKFLDDNKDLLKKPGGGAAGDGGVNHGEQMKLLNEAGIDTEYPFGYCFQVAQFLFYAAGGYSGDYDLKCIKGMTYQVGGVDFSSTHWYIQHKEDATIVDLTASQFDGLLNINDYYSKGARANLGFPYYNVGDKKVEFEDTVPSLQTLKLYSKWREDNKELPVLEKYYKAAKYEKLRKDFTEASFAQSTNEVDDEIKAFESALLKLAANIGDEIDPSEIVYVDGTKENFATVAEILEGIKALDLLERIPADLREQEGEIVYRYTGPRGQRGFCRTMVGLNRVYTRPDITSMNSLNPGFGAGGSRSYSVFKYKGGPNCQHYWEKLMRYNNGNRDVLISLGPAEDDAGETNNANYGSPAGSLTNNGYLMSQNWSFSADEKMIITGPAMIPRSLIARKDELGNLFHVYFSEETIEKIARKFLADNNAHNTDINHNGDVVTENTLLESWIVDNPEMDKSKSLGFNVPKGTWMTSMKINNEETWNKIKTGELNGFSVEGSFLEIVQKS